MLSSGNLLYAQRSAGNFLPLFDTPAKQSIPFLSNHPIDLRLCFVIYISRARNGLDGDI
ncbi:hypothetical protein BofuT4_uP130010.1 [Botrytis cinerea T4]|uniref:Uncharacterized protein n=1 Tax=Botryotinia fuckeliana (strain T4) TaxID=999810 RepID=G2YRQ3_BOTF4|nr:hypothetical protein BofuT4_uP130010.1 [Botrytis cinerea T4]